MPKSGVVLRAISPAVRQLANDAGLAKARLLQPADDWVGALREPHVLLGLIEVDLFSTADLEALEALSGGLTCELILFSDGTPSAKLDKILLNSGGFLFRAPIDQKTVLAVVADVLSELAVEAGQAEEIVNSDLDQFGLLVGSSVAMHKLYRSLRKMAGSDSSVLVVGESGVGKELVANTLHSISDRAEYPFVAINCGALSPELVESELFGHVKGAFTGAQREHQGVFAQAEGGTLFLDEITEMALDHQVKLLRVLETGEYRPLGSQITKQANVRVISATNRDPEQAIDEGFLREDIYFRLAQFPILVPPLRQRDADIPGLAKHFLAYRNTESAANKSISDSALVKISEYPWPGNVRELKYCMERAFILADAEIGPEHIFLDDNLELDASVSTNVPAGVPLEDIERMAIENTLVEVGGNRAEAARQLGISVKTLYNKLEKYRAND